MPTPEARRGRVGHLFELLSGSESLEDFLIDLTQVAADNVERGVSCGLVARVEGRPLIISSSDELAADLERIQDEAGEGPCLEAIAAGAVVEVPDVAASSKWDAWRSRAVVRGVRKSLSLPLATAAGDILGAFTLYSTTAAPFASAERRAAAVFVEHATGALMVAIRLAALAELTGHLETALDSRGIIDQAKGILMARQRCSADEAFDILRRASQARNVKIRDIAAAIVGEITERQLPGE